MDEVKAQIDPFAALAPTLISLIAGPVPGLALKVLSEVLALPIKSDAATVSNKLEETPVSKLPDFIAKAETIARAVVGASQVMPTAAPLPGVPATPEAVAVPVAAAPAVTVTPILAPDPNAKGAFGPLDGYVSYIGIAVVGLGFALGFANVITPDISHAVISIGTAIGGAGLLNKWDKWRKVLPILPALPAA